MPNPERILWFHLRGRQFNGLKFRRQQGIGDFIVDFYCPEQQLVIEVDGDTHGSDDQRTLDGERQGKIEALGIRVIRYSNREVLENIDEVLQDLRLKTTPSPSLGRRGKDHD